MYIVIISLPKFEMDYTRYTPNVNCNDTRDESLGAAILAEEEACPPTPVLSASPPTPVLPASPPTPVLSVDSSPRGMASPVPGSLDTLGLGVPI